MTILAIDTATETLAVAAARDDTWAAHYTHCGLQHAAQLAPHIARVTAELGFGAGEVDLIGVGIGPGSFTGVRIGLATAKGIAAAGRARLVGVSGLDVMGHTGRHFAGLVVPLIDARKHRFYAAWYRQGRRAGPYLDLSPENLTAAVREAAGVDEPVLLTGPAAAQFAAAGVDTGAWLVDRHLPAPAPLSLIELASRGSAAAPGDVLPLYLRQSEAELGIAGSAR